MKLLPELNKAHDDLVEQVSLLRASLAAESQRTTDLKTELDQVRRRLWGIIVAVVGAVTTVAGNIIWGWISG